MNRVLALALVLLAGCTMPGDEADEPELFGACPQWIPSEELIEADVQVNGSAERVLEAATTFQNRSLDMYLLEVDTEAPMRIQAYLPNGARTAFHEVQDDRLLHPPTWEVDGHAEARVFLTAVEQGTAPAPGPLRLTFDGQGDVQLQATPFYRVCGVLVD